MNRLIQSRLQAYWMKCLGLSWYQNYPLMFMQGGSCITAGVRFLSNMVRKILLSYFGFSNNCRQTCGTFFVLFFRGDNVIPKHCKSHVKDKARSGSVTHAYNQSSPPTKALTCAGWTFSGCKEKLLDESFFLPIVSSSPLWACFFRLLGRGCATFQTDLVV